MAGEPWGGDEEEDGEAGGVARYLPCPARGWSLWLLVGDNSIVVWVRSLELDLGPAWLLLLSHPLPRWVSFPSAMLFVSF